MNAGRGSGVGARPRSDVDEAEEDEAGEDEAESEGCTGLRF